MLLRKLKRILSLSVVSLFTSYFSFGQKTEIDLNAYTGIFFFNGTGTTNTTAIVFDPYTTPNIFVTNPYGRKASGSYAFEATIQRVTKKNFIYGAGAGFQSLKSIAEIDSIFENGIVLNKYAASGDVTLQNTFINLKPFAGYRFQFGKINMDALAGFDFAFCLKSKEDAFAKKDGKEYTHIKENIAKPSLDLRPGIQLRTAYKKYGLLIGYSAGLINYRKQSTDKAFSTFLNIGFSYQLR